MSSHSRIRFDSLTQSAVLAVLPFLSLLIWPLLLQVNGTETLNPVVLVSLVMEEDQSSPDQQTSRVLIKSPDALVFALELRMAYDPVTAPVLGVEAGPLASGMAVAANTNRPGLIQVGLAGGMPVGGEGSVLVVTFGTSDKVRLTLTDVKVNEGRTRGVINAGPPRLSSISNMTVDEGGNTGPIPLSVNDTQTAPIDLVFSGRASNTDFVPDANIVFAGSGTDRTVTVTPLEGVTGATTITIRVADEGGLTAERSFKMTVTSGSEVQFHVGTVTGAFDSEIVIPVRVKRFSSILNFAFSMHWRARTAEFIGVEQFGLPGLSVGSFGRGRTSRGTLSVFWTAPDSTAVSVDDGTVAFGVRLRLIEEPGDASAVTIDGTPTNARAFDGQLTPLTVLSVAGQVRALSTVTVAGMVRYYSTNVPVPAVRVVLDGEQKATVNSENDGSYSITANTGNSYIVAPSIEAA